jgi:hypothetical protein
VDRLECRGLRDRRAERVGDRDGREGQYLSFRRLYRSLLWTPTNHGYRVAVVGADGKVEAERTGDRTEFCLGASAHTHYFTNDAAALGVEIARLIEGSRGWASEET